MPAGAGTPSYEKSRSCGLVQRIGAVDSATPHPDPSGGQAPRARDSSLDRATFSGFRPSTFGLTNSGQVSPVEMPRMTNVEMKGTESRDAESGMCFRSIAHLQIRGSARQGVKTRSCDSWYGELAQLDEFCIRPTKVLPQRGTTFSKCSAFVPSVRSIRQVPPVESRHRG